MMAAEERLGDQHVSTVHSKEEQMHTADFMAIHSALWKNHMSVSWQLIEQKSEDHQSQYF